MGGEPPPPTRASIHRWTLRVEPELGRRRPNDKQVAERKYPTHVPSTSGKGQGNPKRFSGLTNGGSRSGISIDLSGGNAHYGGACANPHKQRTRVDVAANFDRAGMFLNGR